MGDEYSDTMNLDLYLGSNASPDTDLGSAPLMNESVNLEDWIERESSHTADLRSFSARTRLIMRQRWLSSSNSPPIPFEARNIASEFMVNTANRNSDILLTGEGSASAKECDDEATHVENEKLGESDERDKGSGDEGNFFDCNICLDVSSDPVLTCCGHLFCWPCLHQWLNVHSDAKECPVCKGEVAMKNLTPIYGRGSNNIHEHDEKTSLKIPDRPQARRVESWRQMIQRNVFTIPMEEMMRRLGPGFSFSRDFTENEAQNESLGDDLRERHSSLLSQLLTSRGMRLEQPATSVVPQEDLVDGRRHALRRSHTYRSAPTAELANITHRLIESYMRYTTDERGGQEQDLLPVDDRNSVSSIAAVIHSEIDPNVSLSTSSSRRRVDVSRVSDVDSGDSRAPRRRRLN